MFDTTGVSQCMLKKFICISVAFFNVAKALEFPRYILFTTGFGRTFAIVSVKSA